jgi:hypothetical protein
MFVSSFSNDVYPCTKHIRLTICFLDFENHKFWTVKHELLSSFLGSRILSMMRASNQWFFCSSKKLWSLHYMIIRSKFTDQCEGWLVWLEKLRKVHGVSLSTKNPHPLCCQACSHTLSTTSCYHSATFNHQAILVTDNCSPESINKPSLSTTITSIQTLKSCNSSTSRKIISQVFEFFNLQTFEQLYSLFKIEEFKDLRFFARGWRIVGFEISI